jgi:hypothetical protein
VLIVEGFQVPLMPLFDASGNAGAFALVHSVGILVKVGIVLAFIVTFLLPDADLHPLLLVTVTDIVNDVPVGGALYWMLVVPLPDVMVDPELSVHT